MLLLVIALMGQVDLNFNIYQPTVNASYTIKEDSHEYCDSIWLQAIREQRGLLIGKNVTPEYMRLKAERENKLWCITQLPNFSDGVTEYPLPRAINSAPNLMIQAKRSNSIQSKPVEQRIIYQEEYVPSYQSFGGWRSSGGCANGQCGR